MSYLWKLYAIIIQQIVGVLMGGVAFLEIFYIAIFDNDHNNKQ